MRVAAGSEAPPDWDAYVRDQAAASIYLRSGWTLLARQVFGHEIYFLVARDESGAVRGVLPLVRQKSLAFGDFMTSLPFFNYGGAVADTPEILVQLMEFARALAQERGCSYLELRDVERHPVQWLLRTDKVSMVLKLPPDTGAFAKQLGSKLRSQIKRADREGATVRRGAAELLDDFYEVFCRTMRDLGTPVYPRRFFSAILSAFPQECLLVIVYRGAVPAAGGFLVCARGRAEIPWAACRNDAKPAGFNMKLYYEAIAAVIERQCVEFDFGRSSRDSGTYRFKAQWGAEPVQLHWHRWEAKARADAQDRPAGPGRVMQLAIRIWSRLPLRIANRLGPWISGGLPW